MVSMRHSDAVCNHRLPMKGFREHMTLSPNDPFWQWADEEIQRAKQRKKRGEFASVEKRLGYVEGYIDGLLVARRYLADESGEQPR